MSILPSGLELKQPPNLKKRQKAYYWRYLPVYGPDKKTVIGRALSRTELLPSDTESKAYYLAKGFLDKNPLEGQGIVLSNTSDNRDGIISTLEGAVKSKDDEIAKLRGMLETKGKEGSPSKVGRPRKT